MKKDKILGFLKLARISNSPTIFSNVLVGVSLGDNIATNFQIIIISFAMLLFYWAGMFLNDLCDLKIDRKQNPQRPLSSGQISPLSALLMVVIFFTFGSILLINLNIPAFLSGIILILLIILYNLWHKGNPLSPFLMALCRIMVYVIAFISVSNNFNLKLLIASFILLVYLVFVTNLAKKENNSVLINKSISFLIAGISLIDALLLSTLGLFLKAVFSIGAFLLTIILQKYIKGT